MKTEATNFIVGRGLLGKKNSQRESEATLGATGPVTGFNQVFRVTCKALLRVASACGRRRSIPPNAKNNLLNPG